MHWKPRSWMLIGVLLTVMTVAGVAQVTTTQVADTIYHADGTVATGTVLISWPAFTTSSGDSIPSGSTSAVIAAGGALSVHLTPNAGATPIGTYYTAVFHLDDGSVSREYWVVPASTTAVKVSAIEAPYCRPPWRCRRSARAMWIPQSQRQCRAILWTPRLMCSSLEIR